MLKLFVLKDNLRSFYGKYAFFINSAVKFIIAFMAALFLNGQLGYMEELATPAVAFIIGIVCAFLPYSAMTLILALFMLVHVASVSIEVAVLIAAIIVIIALLYYGFQPKDSYILVLVPICFHLKIPYVVPLLLGLGGGIISIIPLSCGVIIYYLISYIHLNINSITTKNMLEIPQKYFQIINASFSNKTMLVLVIAFAITLLVVFFVHNLSIDYSWYIAVGAGVISLFIAIFIGEYVFDVNMPIMDGIEFGKIAKKIKPDIYIVIVSGYGEFEFAKKAIKIGVNDYILKPFSEEEIKEVVYKIKDNLDKKYGVIKGLKKKQGLMAENVKAYIVLNFTRANLSVSEIARHFYVDSSYIRRVFKKAYNMSITEYILNLRMEKAKELLVENNFKLSVICEKVGFEDYNYFSRVFKKYCGISPKVYEINNKDIHSHGSVEK